VKLGGVEPGRAAEEVTVTVEVVEEPHPTRTAADDVNHTTAQSTLLHLVSAIV
jgi:hypothetical protein